jgi:hypothetical protein
LFGALAEVGADGVVEVVGDGVCELLVASDQAAVEALAEDVAGARVLVVEGLGVAAVEVLHPGGQVGAGALDDEVVVVAHQAEAVHVPSVAAGDPLQEREEELAVEVVAVDRAAVDAARGQVVDPVGEEEAG